MAATACALAAVGILGCGGSDSGATGADKAASPPPIDKAAFIKRATTICETRREKLTEQAPEVLREERSTGKSRDEIELDLIADVMAPYRKETLEQVRALGAPPGDEERVDAILGAVEEVLDEAEEDPEAFRAKQRNFKYPFKEALKLAEAYGIPACAEA